MGRSSSTAGSQGAEFQVLLVASAFMSPSESKAWSNINRVRMFGGCVGVRTCASMCVCGGGGVYTLLLPLKSLFVPCSLKLVSADLMITKDTELQQCTNVTISLA